MLRGIAAFIVVMSHLMGNYLIFTGQTSYLQQQIIFFILEPLHIEENGGWFGVSLFFFISGFVVTNSAVAESATIFAVRRFSRVYVPLVILVGILWAIAKLKVPYWNSGAAGNLENGLLSMSLLNFIVPGTTPVLDVAWTLAIEILFYLILLTFSHVVKKRAARFLTIFFILSCVFPFLSKSELPGLNLFAATAAALPLLGIGACFQLARAKSIQSKTAILFGVLYWGVFVWGEEYTQTVVGNSNAAFFANSALALLLFSLAVFTEGHIRGNAVTNYVASRSYSIYLIHSPFGFATMLLLKRVPIFFEVKLLCALIVTLVFSEVLYLVAEKPSIKLGRKLSDYLTFAVSRSSTIRAAK